MTALTLDGHLGRPVAIDLCLTCQAFWFDGYESLQLAPASVLRLFRTIGERAGTAATPLSDTCRCPRCGQRLAVIHDQQRNTRFEYRGCAQRHGRLISFFNFLREKDFVRPLSPAQIDALRKNVASVNCSNCGAPVDLVTGAACTHCGSPLSMLDLGQADALLTKLRDAASADAPTIDPALPLALERARLDVNTAFAAFEHDSGFYERVSSAGIVGAVLSSLARRIG